MSDATTLAVTLSDNSRSTSGIIFLTLVAVELGGLAVLRIVRGHQLATEFQVAFSRAGHAHAGVLLILALLAQIFADAADLDGAADIIARDGFWLGAILFPAGFFGASAGRGVTEPNRLIVLVYLGAVSLAAAAICLGVGLLTA